LTADGIDCVSFYGKTSDEQRKEAERRFNEDPNCKVFLGTSAGGTGLNLLGYKPHCPDDYTTNADHVIYYSQNWSPRTQMEDRNHRKGTRCNVRYTDLVVPKTIDEEIRARVIGKKIHALEVGDIREILQAVLR
jgi:DNA repair protein RAD16